MTKNKLKLGLVALGTIATIGLSASAALAAVLEYSANTSVTLTGSGVALVITSGSKATSLVIGTTSLDVVVPTSSTFTVTSANIFNTSGTAGGVVTQSCSSNTNTLVITTTGTTGTYTLTPTGSQCAAVSAGGGGGGGGGDTVPPTNTSVSINAGVTATNTTSVTLTLAATDAYQMSISNTSDFTGATWETYATSKTWVLLAGEGVKTVYAKFRDLAGNISNAVSDTITFSLTAVVTPATPATPAVPATQIEGCTPGNLFSTTSGKSCTVSATPAVPATPATQIEGCTSGNLFSITSGKSCTVSATPATPATPTAGSIPSTGSYKVSLTTGSKGNNVTALQNFLKSQGVDIYPEGLVTGYFGNLTKAAVGRFQLKNGVVTTARDPGYGYVGPKTRAKINSLLGL